MRWCDSGVNFRAITGILTSKEKRHAVGIPLRGVVYGGGLAGIERCLETCMK
jgi:hypothetical protein